MKKTFLTLKKQAANTIHTAPSRLNMTSGAKTMSELREKIARIDELFEKATPGPAAMSGIRTSMTGAHGKAFRVYSEGTEENLAYFPTGEREQEMIYARSDARLFVELVNAWPTLRAALIQKEQGWRADFTGLDVAAGLRDARIACSNMAEDYTASGGNWEGFENANAVLSALQSALPTPPQGEDG